MMFTLYSPSLYRWYQKVRWCSPCILSLSKDDTNRSGDIHLVFSHSLKMIPIGQVMSTLYSHTSDCYWCSHPTANWCTCYMCGALSTKVWDVYKSNRGVKLKVGGTLCTQIFNKVVMVLCLCICPFLPSDRYRQARKVARHYVSGRSFLLLEGKGNIS